MRSAGRPILAVPERKHKAVIVGAELDAVNTTAARAEIPLTHRRGTLKSRSVVVGIVFAAASLAMITGSVLVLGYIIGGASLLLMSGVLIRRVFRRRPTSQLPRAHTRWLDVRDREAA